MRVFGLAAIASVGLTQIAGAQDYSPEEVAAAVLTGFVQRDVAVIAPHSNETNGRFFTRLTSGERDAAELWDEVDRSGGAAQWDGLILPARYRESGNAIIPFAIDGPNGGASLTSGVSGQYLAVVLTLDGPDDTTWGFEDINFVNPGRYNGMSESR